MLREAVELRLVGLGGEVLFEAGDLVGRVGRGEMALVEDALDVLDLRLVLHGRTRA